MEKSCKTCDHGLGGGDCAINLEAECAAGGGFEAWVPRMPKDGLRSCCPKFKARSSFGGWHYVLCNGMMIAFARSDDRDQFYRENCCKSGWNGCGMRLTSSKAENGR